MVTGAAGGIGSAVARVCASLGAEIVGVDRVPLDDLVTILNRDGHACLTFTCDVTDRKGVERICAEAGPIDAAVLNAGMMADKPFEDDDWNASFDEVMAVNVQGPANFARALLPGMQARRRGRIVLIGSIAGHNGGFFSSTPPQYSLTKGAVHTFLRWLAKRAGEHVQVNAVAPGVIDTPMVTADFRPVSGQPITRKGKPEEIAWPVAFLCTPGCSYMTGAIVDVNGGAFMR
ncbi:SDR family NAD(P)-dependent oxidoreductase [Enterovirga sp. CN4-39]|uniref:SDR family NAD(P)-dependent oxidoreductase n=1 Tax=Enterovirga sp. CN4-39 TaxID=3400910 RepID=UPI003C0B7AED